MGNTLTTEKYARTIARYHLAVVQSRTDAREIARAWRTGTLARYYSDQGVLARLGVESRRNLRKQLRERVGHRYGRDVLRQFDNDPALRSRLIRQATGLAAKKEQKRNECLRREEAARRRNRALGYHATGFSVC